MAARREVAIGFAGGQVLTARLTDESITELRDALGSDGWHEIDTEEGAAQVRLDKVVYVRVASEEHRVGFG